MHPTVEYQIAKVRIADWQRQADRIAIAHAASRASRGLTWPGRHPAAGLARRVFTVLARRRLPATARSRQLACQPLASCSSRA
jgi:hypothetical protein